MPRGQTETETDTEEVDVDSVAIIGSRISYECDFPTHAGAFWR